MEWPVVEDRGEIVVKVEVEVEVEVKVKVEVGALVRHRPPALACNTALHYSSSL